MSTPDLNAALDGSGTAWVVFDAEPATRASEVFIARVDASSEGAVRLTKDDGAPSKYPDLGIGPGGLAALSWQDDRDGNFYAVQWFYTVHAAGAVVHSRAEDRKRAHEYADAYMKTRGPQAALVKQWVDYLDQEK